MDKPNFGGMTTNARLYAAGLLDAWDAAVHARDRDRMIEVLCQVDLASQAESISDLVLLNPGRYGFRDSKGTDCP
jgi:hypothetical protein